LPTIITADSGYGSEENYVWLERQDIQGYVKYNYFHKEQREASKQKPKLLDPNTLHYDEQADRYICPMGQDMKHVSTRQRKTTTGYVQTTKTYPGAELCQLPSCGKLPSCQRSAQFNSQPKADRIENTGSESSPFRRRYQKAKTTGDRCGTGFWSAQTE
jgi:hypothetical protein